MNTTRILTKRIDAVTTAVMRPCDPYGRQFVAGWVHENRDSGGHLLYTAQRNAGCNPARNNNMFTDMNAAVQWLYAPWVNA